MNFEQKPHVIILNGVGSVGKSSTARALQDRAVRPLLHLSMDTFAAMMPERLFGNPEGMVFETTRDDCGKPSVIVRTGSVMERTLRGMRHAVAAMAACGNDIVVDDVMMSVAEAEAYRALLGDAELRFVGLFAPLDVLEARELARGDRAIGLAQQQFDQVHRGQRYDLEIDTSVMTPIETAEAICVAFGLERREASLS